MRRYVLLEIDGTDGYDLVSRGDTRVRLLCSGTAAQCLLSAAEEMPSHDIHDVRLYQLPAVQRRTAAGERNGGLGAGAVDPERESLAATN